MQPISQKTAVLFDIQRFSVNDGPGIRTNIFFKGCPLRCVWCHNPESYQMGRQLSIVSSACVNCKACEKVCPNGETCSGCGSCVEVCCYGARSMIGKAYTVEELYRQVIIDEEFYRIGEETGEGGGITLTGGEPLAQFEFIDEFLNAVTDIHICMETSGYGAREHFEKLLGRVSLFLYDLKATDSKRHKELCGNDNKLILDNLEYLCGQNADIILRIPLIAGVNDDERHIKCLSEIIKAHKNIRHGEIMAYHNLGVSKAEQIGWKESVLHQENSSGEQKEKWLEHFHKYGVENIKLG